jgi:uncharacterized protein (DUF1810 family)
MDKRHEVAKCALVRFVAGHGPIFLDCVCSSWERGRKRCRWWAFVVIVFIHVKHGKVGDVFLEVFPLICGWW